MKVSKNCGVSTDEGCFSNGSPEYDKDGNENSILGSIGDGILDHQSFAYKFVLADGTSVAILVVYGVWYVVNLDGSNKRPVWGKNTFIFGHKFINDNSVSDEISADAHCEFVGLDSLENCLKNGSCANWVIQNGNMDYLKADEDGKCPNGTQLSDTVTSCK